MPPRGAASPTVAASSGGPTSELDAGESPARRAAFEALRQVARADGFAKQALDEVCAKRAVRAEDRGLASELCYGVLRFRARLDHALAARVHRGLASVHPEVLDVLRLGAYQLFFSRVPAHAAVDESVRLARITHAGEAGARFVNAILRGLARDGEPPLPDPTSDAQAHLAVKWSFPAWMVARVRDAVGDEQVAALLEAFDAPAPLHVRANALRTTREALVETLAGEGARASATPHAAQCLAVESLRDVAVSPAFAAGLYTVQDEASQLVALLCDPAEDARILDLCAAPGGKATALAERASRGRVDAVDRSPRKVAQVRGGAVRLGLSHVHTFPADGAAPLPFAQPGEYDLVLVDAPCTGLGVLRRHPEAKWRVTEEDVARLAVQQSRLLANAARYAKPGGALVYSVCTFTREETTDVTRAFLANHAEFALEPPSAEDLARLAPAGELRLFPHTHGTDAFYAARLRKAGAA